MTYIHYSYELFVEALLCLGGRSPGGNTVVVVCVCLSVCLSLLFPRDG